MRSETGEDIHILRGFYESLESPGVVFPLDEVVAGEGGIGEGGVYEVYGWDHGHPILLGNIHPNRYRTGGSALF